jgi:hypothetical protein
MEQNLHTAMTMLTFYGLCNTEQKSDCALLTFLQKSGRNLVFGRFGAVSRKTVPLS